MPAAALVGDPDRPAIPQPQVLWAGALACLREDDCERKLALTRTTAAAFAEAADAELKHDSTEETARDLRQPGRPPLPQLVPPQQLRKRPLHSAAGRVALVHAVAHIEFNAINLAWDAVCRFPGMPPDYYRDWASVAADEARHFQLLRTRLRELGSDYGELPAHDGLWSMALATAADPLQRMALVPRVLEARGLDVTPGMIERLLAAGDEDTVAALRVILAEEERHVWIGSRWYRYLCAQRGLDPQGTFFELLREHGMDRRGGPMNVEARLRAGFDPGELSRLAELAASR